MGPVGQLYSLLLVKMFKEHKNVEACQSEKSRHIHLQEDKQRKRSWFWVGTTKIYCLWSWDFSVGKVQGQQISSLVIWQILLIFPIHECCRIVVHISVYLRNDQNVYINPNNFKWQQLQFSKAPKTLCQLCFFVLYKLDPFAQTSLYCDTPRYTIWIKSGETLVHRTKMLNVFCLFLRVPLHIINIRLFFSKKNK